MKRINKYVICIVAITIAVVSISTIVKAQTSDGAVNCPAGYICTPIVAVVNCPQGYICRPIDTTTVSNPAVVVDNRLSGIPFYDTSSYCPYGQSTTGGVCLDYQTKRLAVQRLYETIQCREPDAQGWDYWTNSSSDLSSLGESMKYGIEYSTKQQVIQIFQNQLGRSPSCNIMNGTSELHTWYEKAYSANPNYPDLSLVRNGIGGNTNTNTNNNQTIPSITILSPMGNETWASGSTHRISWSAVVPSGMSSKFDIIQIPTPLPDGADPEDYQLGIGGWGREGNYYDWAVSGPSGYSKFYLKMCISGTTVCDTTRIPFNVSYGVAQ